LYYQKDEWLNEKSIGSRVYVSFSDLVIQLNLKRLSAKPSTKEKRRNYIVEGSFFLLSLFVSFLLLFLFLSHAERAFARPLEFSFAQLCEARHTDVCVEQRRKRKRKRKRRRGKRKRRRGKRKENRQATYTIRKKTESEQRILLFAWH